MNLAQSYKENVTKEERAVNRLDEMAVEVYGTMQRLCLKAGFDQSNYACWKRGPNKPSWRMIKKIAKALPDRFHAELYLMFGYWPPQIAVGYGRMILDNQAEELGASLLGAELFQSISGLE